MTGMISNSSMSNRNIEFAGLTRADSKRKALNYWYLHKNKLRLSIREFSARLALLDDGKTIVFAPPPRSR